MTRQQNVQTVRISENYQTIEVKSVDGLVFGVDCGTVRIIYHNAILADTLSEPSESLMKKASTRQVDITVRREVLVTLSDEGLLSNGVMCNFDNPYLFDWLAGQRDVAGNRIADVEITFVKER